MSRRTTAAEIDAAAARWAARMDRGDLSDDARREFDDWISGDPRRLGAFAKAQAVLAFADRSRALQSGGEPPRTDDGVALAAIGRPSRRALFYGGGGLIAAALAGVGFLGVDVLVGRERIRTEKGEIRRVPLSDGSVVTLNTASVIRVNFSGAVRRIDLVRGEALFDVAKDHTRPFVVATGDTRVRAVGTSFTVRRLESGAVRVVVQEGVVEVRRGAAVAPVRVGANTAAVAVERPGTAAASPIVVTRVQPEKVSNELAWRVGMLSFEGETLAQACAEFERYSDTRIVVADQALGRKTITGLFSANDPKGFARAAAISLDARAEVEGDRIRLRPARS